VTLWYGELTALGRVDSGALLDIAAGEGGGGTGGGIDTCAMERKGDKNRGHNLTPRRPFPLIRVKKEEVARVRYYKMAMQEEVVKETDSRCRHQRNVRGVTVGTKRPNARQNKNCMRVPVEMGCGWLVGRGERRTRSSEEEREKREKRKM
jgi:hypothetical protein